MKLSLTLVLVIVVTGKTFALAACKNDGPAKDHNQKSSMTKEKPAEDVQY